MARRLFKGNAFSEDGWPYVDTGSCMWITVPGTSVSLQIQVGAPAAIMGAFAADFNAYIEQLRDPDSACWTEGNSVATSNHPSGTAMDLNWDSHAFEERGSFNADELRTIQELLDFYEGTIFWAGVDWSAGGWGSPIDEMHWQMGYGTYDTDADRPDPKCQDFINRKIRPDGFSTFRRGDAPVLSAKDRYALATITEGRRLGITPKGICIALAVELVETNLTMYANSNVPASLDYPHDAVGSDHDSTGLFQQRQAWGPLSSTMDPTLSAGLFFNGGQSGQRGLTDFDYNSDSRTPGGWAQAVQVSAFPDRYDERYAEAEQLYNRLSTIGDEDDMFTDDDRNLLQQISGIFRPSMSALRHLAEGNVNTCAGFAWSADGLIHPQFVAMAARYGHHDSLALLAEVAGADPTHYPDRQADAALARAILADIEATNPAVLQQFLTQNGVSTS